MSDTDILIHLVSGPTGAGKSTYSGALTDDLGGVRFSIDEWMQRLHNQDQPEQMSFDWFYERVQRNCEQMRSLASQLCKIGVASVFDCGLTNSEQRAIFADWADANGYAVTLHFIDVPADVRWGRVSKRNVEKAETFQFEVTRPMFDFIEGLWEAPTEMEMSRMSGVVVKN